jgi:dTDP-4-dehydrorhamnose reductase
VIVVTGADGQLGTAFRSVLPKDSVFLNRSDLDLENLDRIAPTIGELKPTAVINCAAYTAVDQAEEAQATANTVNGHAVGEMAAACRSIGSRFVTISTDFVFDGSKVGPYVESDEPAPLNAYGASKRLGEELALKANPDSLVVRTSWLQSRTHQNFITTILARAREGGATVVADQRGRPTFVDDLAPSILEALHREASGILHLANGGTTTWYGLARAAVEIAGMDPELIRPCTTAEYPTKARRPLNSELSSERLEELGMDPLPHYWDSLSLVVSHGLG